MQYCEEQFLTVAEKYGLCSTEMAAMSLTEVLALHTPVHTHVLCWITLIFAHVALELCLSPSLAEVSDMRCWTGGKHPIEISRSLVQRWHARTLMCM